MNTSTQLILNSGAVVSLRMRAMHISTLRATPPAPKMPR